MRSTLAVLAVALLVPSAASAATDVTPDTTPDGKPVQAWIDASQVPTPTERVSVVVGPCPGNGDALGCTAPDAPVIYLDPDATQEVFLHEVGHRFDFAILTDLDRRRAMILMGLPGKPTYLDWIERGNVNGSGRTPEETWADAFSFCAIHGPTADPESNFHSGIWAPLRGDAVNALCALMVESAARPCAERRCVKKLVARPKARTWRSRKLPAVPYEVSVKRHGAKVKVRRCGRRICVTLRSARPVKVRVSYRPRRVGF